MLTWIVRHYKMGVLLIGIVVGGYSLLFLGPMGIPTSTIVLVLVAALLPWILAYQFANQKLSQDALKAINEDCDPEPLLEVADITLQQFDKRGRSRRNQILGWRMNRVVALSCLGRHEEALEELDLVERRLPRMMGQMHLLYHNNRAMVLGDLKRAEDMSMEMQKALGLLGGLKIPSNLREVSVLAVRSSSCTLAALEEGYTPEVEAEYKELLEANETKRWQVTHRLGLARCAVARGDEVTARQHLDFVLRYGNKLEARRQAEELMDQLNR